jgi:hypothetical protein
MRIPTGASLIQAVYTGQRRRFWVDDRGRLTRIRFQYPSSRSLQRLQVPAHWPRVDSLAQNFVFLSPGRLSIGGLRLISRTLYAAQTYTQKEGNAPCSIILEVVSGDTLSADLLLVRSVFNERKKSKLDLCSGSIGFPISFLLIRPRP